MPILVPMNMSLLTRCALTLIPGWDDILTQPVERRMELLRDPEVRAAMRRDAEAESAGVFRRLNRWAEYHIGDTYSEANRPLEGRRVGDIAEERGIDPFDALIDIALADDLRTVLWPTPLEDDDESWAMRMELLDSGRAMVGGSDGGAHLDRMMGSVYPTRFLADTIRGRRLVRLERAVQMMTDDPARLFGLRERGRRQRTALRRIDRGATGARQRRPHRARRRAHRRSPRCTAAVGARHSNCSDPRRGGSDRLKKVRSHHG